MLLSTFFFHTMNQTRAKSIITPAIEYVNVVSRWNNCSDSRYVVQTEVMKRAGINIIR